MTGLWHKGGERRAEPGFSMLEILVAFTILLLALLAMAAIFPTGHTFIKQSSNLTKASFIAQSVLEEYRRKPWAQIVTGQGSITLSDVFMDNSSSNTYNYTVTVVDVNDDMKRIKVEVTWQGKMGNRKVQAASLIYNQLE